MTDTLDTVDWGDMVKATYRAGSINDQVQSFTGVVGHGTRPETQYKRNHKDRLAQRTHEYPFHHLFTCVYLENRFLAYAHSI